MLLFLYREFVSTFHLFCLQAPDFAVARFIKYSDEHTSKLEQALSHLAQSVSIDVSNSKNIQYELRPVYVSRTFYCFIYQFILC